MAATGFTFASYSGAITLPTQSTPSYSQTAIEQKDMGKETNSKVVKLPVGAISEDTAKKAVLTANPQAQIVGVETEDENGTIAYNISLKDGTDVKVDAVKGTILATDKRGNEGKIDSDKETNDDSVVNSDKETKDGSSESAESANDSDSQNED